jgi:hypothetical protein
MRFTLRDLFWLTLDVAAWLWFIRFLSGVDPETFFLRAVWGSIPVGLVTWLWAIDRDRRKRKRNTDPPK